MNNLRTIPELVNDAARTYGGRVATREARADGRTLSFDELAKRMRFGASRLRSIDPRPGQTALLLLEPRYDWLAALSAILEAGWVAVPLPHDVPAGLAAAVAQRAQCRAAIVSSHTRAGLARLPELPQLDAEALLDDHSSTAEPASIDESQLALLAFTSGSTQRPKAVALTHGNLTANLQSLLAIRRGGTHDAMLSVLPPAHLFALVAGTLAPLACGAQIVYPSSLLPNRLTDALRAHSITHALAVPALADCLYRELLDQLIDAGGVPAALRSQSPAEVARLLRDIRPDLLGSLRGAVRERIGERFQSLVIGGAAVDPHLAEVVAAVGIGVELGYGLTEAGPIVAVGKVGQCPPRSVGQPLPGVDVRIDSTGEILVRSPGVMRGYLGDSQATAEALADGWLHTGDSGRLDERGNLYILGRIKEAIVTPDGRTTYPEDIEPYYFSPRFAEYCVSAIPDAEGNDVPVLFVVPAEPACERQHLATTFESLRQAAPAAFRVSRLHVLASALPRTATGKIRRRAVAELAFPSETGRMASHE